MEGARQRRSSRLEIILVATGDLVSAVLSAWDGHSSDMPSLENALAQTELPDPMAELQRLAEAASFDLTALPMIHASGTNLRPGGAAVLASQLGWVVKSLRGWNAAADPTGRRLTAILLAASFWDVDGRLWSKVRPHVTDWEPITRALPHIIGMRISVPELTPGAPLWQREVLAAFESANLQGDWKSLSDMASSFSAIRLDPAALEAVRALWELARPSLVTLADGATRWTQAAQLVNALPTQARLALALESSSGHLRLAALESTKSHARSMPDPREAAALEELFVDLARDSSTWPTWLATFNTWPARLPGFQPALGRALARSSEGALSAWVESVALTTRASSRDAVGECLTAFAAAAPQELRRNLWKLCFERWTRWHFGSEQDDALLEIGRSDLDYGVSGWLIEFADGEQAATEVRCFRQNLRKVENAWYRSDSALRSAVMRLLSRYQLFAHAADAREPGEWLTDKVYMPDLMQEPYFQARYSQRRRS